MRKLRVYVDTSVFGGVNDDEFALSSRRFFDLVRRGKYSVLVSIQTTTELEGAPVPVREVLKGLTPGQVEEVPVDSEVYALADAYIGAGVLGEAARGDAIHVAAATVAGADLIVSWNFKHIVRYDRIQKFNAVNTFRGYRGLDIRSPLEVGDDEEE